MQLRLGPAQPLYAFNLGCGYISYISFVLTSTELEVCIIDMNESAKISMLKVKGN